MLRKKLVHSVCAAAMLAAAAATTARAQGPLDARTEFTFNQPVELPNVTLPPGTYVFRFVDATTGRKVMHVQAKGGDNKTYGLFLTIAAQRPTASDDAELRFLETPAGAPAAVKTWWYPGNTIGREFIYPKTQARRLAEATNQPVLTTQADRVTDEQMKTADLAYMSPSGQEAPMTDAEMDQAVRAAATTPPVGAVSDQSDAPVQQGTMARAALPETSTPLAGIGLVGLFSLLSAVALRLRS